MGNFKELIVWQKAKDLAVKIYQITDSGSYCKDYGLKDQMTRAAVSIPSNIAEGAERDSTKEFIRYLHIAKGSAAELKTQLYIAHRVNLVPENDHQEIIANLQLLSRKIHCLINYLKNNDLRHKA